MSQGDERRALAEDAWRSLFDFFIRTRPQRDRVLAKLGLTTNDAKALGTLEPHEGIRMSELAERWSTDASNATWVITRLEQRGLVERRSPDTDRRVKLATLTPRGRALRAKLMRALYEPPPELGALSPHDLETLRAILDKTR